MAQPGGGLGGELGVLAERPLVPRPGGRPASTAARRSRVLGDVVEEQARRGLPGRLARSPPGTQIGLRRHVVPPLTLVSGPFGSWSRRLARPPGPDLTLGQVQSHEGATPCPPPSSSTHPHPARQAQRRLKDWHPVDLAAETLKALTDRTGIDPAVVDDVVMGCVMQVGEQGVNIARNAVLAAGWPETVPGTTVDRQCGSSQQAAHFAAQGVIAGAYDVVVAAGVEVMTRVPMGASIADGKYGFPFGPEGRRPLRAGRRSRARRASRPS